MCPTFLYLSWASLKVNMRSLISTSTKWIVETFHSNYTMGLRALPQCRGSIRKGNLRFPNGGGCELVLKKGTGFLQQICIVLVSVASLSRQRTRAKSQCSQLAEMRLWTFCFSVKMYKEIFPLGAGTMEPSDAGIPDVQEEKGVCLTWGCLYLRCSSPSLLYVCLHSEPQPNNIFLLLISCVISENHFLFLHPSSLVCKRKEISKSDLCQL